MHACVHPPAVIHGSCERPVKPPTLERVLGRCCLRGAWSDKQKYHLWFMGLCVLGSGAPAEVFKPDADVGVADVCGDSEGSAASSPGRHGAVQGVFTRLLPRPCGTRSSPPAWAAVSQTEGCHGGARGDSLPGTIPRREGGQRPESSLSRPCPGSMLRETTLPTHASLQERWKPPAEHLSWS